MAVFYKLNYPITTPEAIKFWASRHKCNRMKAVIAFSTDLQDANMNLRNDGFALFWREKAIANFGQYVNQPAMIGIPFTPMSIPYWECMPFDAPTTPTLGSWSDTDGWVDTESWTEF